MLAGNGKLMDSEKVVWQKTGIGDVVYVALTRIAGIIVISDERETRQQAGNPQSESSGLRKTLC
jgi:hypothetical protein